jgi:lambda family phage minor tail protein L
VKDFSATILAAAKAQLEASQPLIWLVSVEVPTSPPTRYRLTSYPEAVARGQSSTGAPLTYAPFPLAFGDFRQSSKGDLSPLTINVANVTAEMMVVLNEHAGLVGQEAVIRMVHVQALADPNAEVSWRGRISGCAVDDTIASFTLGAVNLQKLPFPANRYVANHCQVRYGGVECGYIIPASPGDTVGTGFSFCSRTLSACDERGLDELARGLVQLHPLRFGAQPGIAQGTAN